MENKNLEKLTTLDSSTLDSLFTRVSETEETLDKKAFAKLMGDHGFALFKDQKLADR